MLSDLALASIAQRPPRTREALEQVRSLDGRQLSSGVGDELLRAISQGVGLGADALQLPPAQVGDNAAKAAVMLIAAWIGERAHELGMDPSLLATRADLTAYCRVPPSGRLATSWRQQLIGEPIRRLLAGEASLALDRSANLVLEERSGRPITSSLP